MVLAVRQRTALVAGRHDERARHLREREHVVAGRGVVRVGRPDKDRVRARLGRRQVDLCHQQTRVTRHNRPAGRLEPNPRRELSIRTPLADADREVVPRSRAERPSVHRARHRDRTKVVLTDVHCSGDARLDDHLDGGGDSMPGVIGD